MRPLTTVALMPQQNIKQCDFVAYQSRIKTFRKRIENLFEISKHNHESDYIIELLLSVFDYMVRVPTALRSKTGCLWVKSGQTCTSVAHTKY